MSADSATRQLVASGVAIWLDDLSRAALDDGSLARLIAEADVSGVTTNPTIFHRAITTGSAYDAALDDLAARGATAEEAVDELTVADVARACDLFDGVWRASGGRDGRVSIEVAPALAHDAAATLAEAHRLRVAVARPNVLIKIPATPAGVVAIEEAVAAGISVNVTLIFSLERYRDVIRAYQSGLDRALAAGIDLAGIHSVASFFVSRVDAEVDARLAATLGQRAAPLRGRAALANAHLAYALSRTLFAGPRWEALAASGATVQRPLWASTGVKDPVYPDTLYVTELVAPGVVNTMPRSTLAAVQDHGMIRGDTVSGRADRARRVLDELAEAGIDYDDVVAQLEREGVTAFVASGEELLADVRRRLAR